LENTINGKVMPLKNIHDLRSFGIPMHLDGARLWNAYIKHKKKYTLQDWCDPFSTVSLCFSKGIKCAEIRLRRTDWGRTCRINESN
jgi:threonine aldolase